MQQVNLYRDILKHEQQQSGLKLAGMVLGVLFALFALFSLYLWWDIYQKGGHLKQEQQTLTQQQARMDALLSKRASNQPSSQLTEEIGLWQAKTNDLAQAMQLLASKRQVLSKGFSYYLRALAIHPNPEVWLTAIHIDGQNEEIRLEGSTFKPQKIPQTLQLLQTKPALKGLTFGKLVLHQSEKIPGQMDFILGNPDKPEDGKGHDQ